MQVEKTIESRVVVGRGVGGGGDCGNSPHMSVS